MNIMDYISGNSLYLIPVLYILGVFLKNTPRVKDWLIPWILTVCGIIGGCFTMETVASGVIQGVLAAGAAVLGNQLLKQTANKDSSNNC